MVLTVALSHAGAQTPRKALYRIGILSPSDQSSPYRDAFVDGMRTIGYQEGRDYVIASRFAEGKLDRLPMLAAELVELKVDVIVLGSIPAALASQKATKSIPIVVGGAGDFVGNGLVASLEQPGGNITGLDEVVPGLAGRRLRLLSEAVRLRSPVTILSSATGPTHAKQMQDAESTAASLGVRLVTMRVADAKDFESAFEAMAREKASATVVFSGVLTNVHRKRIVELAAQYRLPTIHWNEAYVTSGGLMYYGPNLPGMFRRSATFVDKILKGASPSVLPVEYPQEFELIINLRTAKELGLTIPKTLLEKADRLLE
jgi:putative ABC transport system substrate-binding protein